MRLNAYSIYDRKTLAYHTPFFSVTDGAAIRSFTDLANDSNTNIGRHPADYVLFCVGEYEDQVGALIPISPLRHVIDATATIQQQAEMPFMQGAA